MWLRVVREQGLGNRECVAVSSMGFQPMGGEAASVTRVARHHRQDADATSTLLVGFALLLFFRHGGYAALGFSLSFACGFASVLAFLPSWYITASDFAFTISAVGAVSDSKFVVTDVDTHVLGIFQIMDRRVLLIDPLTVVGCLFDIACRRR